MIRASLSLADLLDHARSRGRPVLLDGAMGTELDNRGCDTSGPAWSARAILERPDVVRAVHREYAAAGSEILLANTFRTTARAFASAGLAASWRAAAQSAVRIAIEASEGRALVAASVGPLEECYAPALAPDADTAYQEHLALIETVRNAGAHAAWIETMGTVREARAAAMAACEAGMPFVVSFVPIDDGAILDGTPLSDAIVAILDLEPAAVLLNCAPAPTLDRNLATLRSATRLPVGLKAHLGRPQPNQPWTGSAFLDPDAFAEKALQWARQGVNLLGGCCGSTPSHIAALSRGAACCAPRISRDP